MEQLFGRGYCTVQRSKEGPEIWVAGGSAYALHLLADSLTNRGIRPLPPLKLRIRANLMSTGTKHGATCRKCLRNPDTDFGMVCILAFISVVQPQTPAHYLWTGVLKSRA